MLAEQRIRFKPLLKDGATYCFVRIPDIADIITKQREKLNKSNTPTCHFAKMALSFSICLYTGSANGDLIQTMPLKK